MSALRRRRLPVGDASRENAAHCSRQFAAMRYPKGMPLAFPGGRSGLQTVPGDHHCELRLVATNAGRFRTADCGGAHRLTASRGRSHLIADDTGAPTKSSLLDKSAPPRECAPADAAASSRRRRRRRSLGRARSRRGPSAPPIANHSALQPLSRSEAMNCAKAALVSALPRSSNAASRDSAGSAASSSIASRDARSAPEAALLSSISLSSRPSRPSRRKARMRSA